MTQTLDKSTPSSSSPSSVVDLASTMGLSLGKDDPAYVANTPVTETAIEDNDDFESDDDAFDPERNRFKLGLHNSGITKAAFVGGSSLVVVLGVMTFYKGAIPSHESAKTPTSKPEAVVKDPRTAALEAAQKSESQTKAELALQKQRDQFSQFKPIPQSNTKVPVKPTVKPTPKLDRSPPVTTVSHPAPPAISAPEPIPEPLVPIAPAPAPVISSPGITPPPAISATESDPAAEWQRLATAGRFGTVTPGSGRAVAIASTPPVKLSTQSTDPRKPNGEKLVSDRPVVPPSSTPPLSQYFRAPVTTAQSSRRTILVGTSAQASTLTPILWTPKNGTVTARFIIRLNEAMLDSQGTIALPAGTQIIVGPKAADATTALVELEVISVLINGAEFAPPAGALVIRDRKGGMLMGDDYFHRRGKVAKRDLMLVLASALGSVGELTNRPLSTSSSSVSGSNSSVTTSTQNNRKPNYLGAALEGGFSALSEQISERNEQAIDEILQAPKVYQLKSGRKVQVFVNQSMSF